MSSTIQGSSSSQPLVIVDDQDDSIEYNGGWDHKGDSINFQGTASGTAEVGASLTFEFVGSYVAVYADVSSGLGSSTVNFSLDNDSQKASYEVRSSRAGDESAEVNDGSHVLIWESTRDLTDKNHNLVITKTASDEVNGESLLIDFFVYAPTESTKFGESTALFVDDRHPGVVYGNQTQGGGQGWEQYDQATPPINHTLTYTTGQGSVMSYTFLGTGISMYGMLESSNSGAATLNLDVTVDDQPAQQFQAGLPSLVSYGTRFFHIKDLVYGNHTVKVANTNNETLDFDFFLVTPGVAPTTTSASTPSQSSGSTSSGSTPSDAGGRSVPVGAIAGGVIGALVLVGLIGALLVLMRRRRNQKRSFSSDNLMSDNSITPQPYPYLVSLSGNSSSASPARSGRKGLRNLTTSSLALFSGKRSEVVEPVSASTNEKEARGSNAEGTSILVAEQSPVVTVRSGTGTRTRASAAPSASDTSQEPYVDSGIRFDSRPPPLYTEQ